MSEVHEFATTPQHGVLKDDREQGAIPPGKYLTGLRLVLVCTRSVVFLDLQIEHLLSNIQAHLSYARKPLHLHFPGDGRDLHCQHLSGHHFGRFERL